MPERFLTCRETHPEHELIMSLGTSAGLREIYGIWGIRSWGILVTATGYPEQSDQQKPSLEAGDTLKFAQGGKFPVSIL